MWKSGRGWPKDSSGAVALHYFVQSLTGKLEENAARGEIERAFREWQKYANVTLTPGGAPTRRAPSRSGLRRQSMATACHSTVLGGTLAHTYYPAPPNPEPIAGDMHLDADENWHIGTAIDLYHRGAARGGACAGAGTFRSAGRGDVPVLPFRVRADVRRYRGDPGSVWRAVTGPPPLHSGPIPVAVPRLRRFHRPRRPCRPPPAAPPSHARADARRRRRSHAAVGAYRFACNDGRFDTAASLAVSGTATDDTGVVAVKWTTSTGDSGDAAGTASWSAAIPLYVGNTVVTVRAYDAAGNSGWRALTVTRR